MQNHFVEDIAMGLAAIHKCGMPKASCMTHIKEYRRLGGRGSGLAIAFGLVRKNVMQPLALPQARDKMKSICLAEALLLIGWPLPTEPFTRRNS